MDFLGYTDIHHDEYNNGITEDDVTLVEDQITDYAMAHSIKNVMFLGDWMRATNPLRSVVAAAESSWKRRSDAGIVTWVDVGNHDRFTKSANSGHIFISAEIFRNDLRNIKVIDVAKQVNIDGINFFFIPAGHENTETVRNFARDPSAPLVVLFHGLVAGSALANGGSVSGGIHPDILRRLQAELALGGDNHTSQSLNELLGYESMYLGAPMQHNWGDRGQKRGFWHFQFHGNGPCPWHKEFIPTISPRFVRMSVEASDDMQTICSIAARLEEELEGSPGIVDIKLIGPNARAINQDLIEDSLRGFKIRRLKILVDHSHERLEVAPGLAVAEQPEDKWAAYIAHGRVPGMEGLSPSMLAEMGKWALTKAKQEI